MGKICVLAVVLVAIELCTFLNAHVHTHSHGGDQEPAHYKYSREANEAVSSSLCNCCTSIIIENFAVYFIWFI